MSDGRRLLLALVTLGIATSEGLYSDAPLGDAPRMRRVVPLLLLGSAISVIPGAQQAHSSQCVWQVSDLKRFVGYDHVFTGTIIEAGPLRRVIFVDTILKGWRFEAGSTVELQTSVGTHPTSRLASASPSPSTQGGARGGDQVGR